MLQMMHNLFKQKNSLTKSVRSKVFKVLKQVMPYLKHQEFLFDIITVESQI